jgi:hypothetical protein
VTKITPLNVWASSHWATVTFAWLLTAVVCGFLWWNYRKVLQLRRLYMKTEEYQQSLHARTLMVRMLAFSQSCPSSANRLLAIRYPQDPHLGRRHCQNHR